MFNSKRIKALETKVTALERANEELNYQLVRRTRATTFNRRRGLSMDDLAREIERMGGFKSCEKERPSAEPDGI